MKSKPIETLCLCRVSSDKQAKNENITSQKQSCLLYAKHNGFVIDKFFYEDGVSGRGEDRPGLSQIKEYIEREHKSKRIRVMFYDMSRLARNMGVYTDFEKIIIKHDIELLTVVGGKSENNALGRFARGFDVLRAQLFSDELSEKTVDKMKALSTLGYYQFNPPLGLKRVENEEKRTILVRDEPRASVIYEAFVGYAAGRFATKHEVTLFLQNSGAFNGIKLNDTKVAAMLKNEVYTGVFAYEPWDIPRQEWKMEQLIPVDLFQAVQSRLQRNGRAPRRTNNADAFPLAGLVCCPQCGHPMTGYFARGHKGKLHPYYRCYNKACSFNKKSIQRTMVENALQERLNAIQTDDRVLDLFSDVLNRVCREKELDITEQIQKARADIERFNTRIASLGGLLADAGATGNGALVELYQGQILAMTQQKKELESRVGVYKPLSATETFRTAMRRGREFFKNPGILWKIGTLHQKKRLVRMLFLEKPKWDAENGFRTARMPRIFNEKSAQTDGLSDLAVQIELNSNQIIADVLEVVEILDDADFALYSKEMPEDINCRISGNKHPRPYLYR